MDQDLSNEGIPLWLPGERWEMGLQARLGGVTPPSGGPPMLMVTTHRAILVNQQSGRRATSLLPLASITGIEVVDTSRPTARFVQGLLLLGTGVLLATAVWVVLETLLFVLIAGAMPGLAGVYLLAAYLFPDQQGELLLHTAGHTARMPLLTAGARRDAHLAAHRLSELTSTVAALTPVQVAKTSPDATSGAVHADETPGNHSPPVPEEPTAPAPTPEEVTSPAEPDRTT